MTKFTFIVLATLFSSFAEFCGIHEGNNVLHLGTKTPYRLVANLDESEVNYPGCRPTKILGIIRHGTRTPGHKNVKKMEEIMSGIREDFKSNYGIFISGSKLCEDDKSAIKNWTLYMDVNEEKYLTEEGGKEMILLAKRLQKRFPSLLSSYKNESFLFRFTKTQRTEESAKHFVLGLFGKDPQVWFPEPVDPDPVLRFYKLCKKWRTEVKKSPASTKEKKTFVKSLEMQRTLKSVSEKLELNYTLSYDSVQVMYLVCCFESAWFPKKKSPWCSPFETSDIKVLEYAEELKYYWRDGYGFEINYNQSCPLFENVLNFLKSEDNLNAVFYFTHSGTILKALSRLGLYRDPFSITASLNPDERERRLWRVSFIDTFGSNLLFTLFKASEIVTAVQLVVGLRSVRSMAVNPQTVR